MRDRRFAIIGLFLVQVVVVQLGLSLLFIPNFVDRDPATLISFILASLHTILTIAIVAAQHYLPYSDPFYKRLGLVVYNMMAASKLVTFSNERICATCLTAGTMRICLAMLENLFANVLFERIWRTPDRPPAEELLREQLDWRHAAADAIGARQTSRPNEGDNADASTGSINSVATTASTSMVTLDLHKDD